jgi:hypothetical protein
LLEKRQLIFAVKRSLRRGVERRVSGHSNTGGVRWECRQAGGRCEADGLPREAQTGLHSAPCLVMKGDGELGRSSIEIGESRSS